MDLIKAEIARKRAQIESRSVLAPEKKYFKRGDLSQKEDEEYIQKHKQKRENSQKEKEKHLNLLLQSKQKDKQTASTSTTDDSSFPILPRQEVISRLRDRLEPILIFGETEEEACKRLGKIEVEEPEKITGNRNDFKEALAKVDEVYLQEIAKNQTEEEESKKSKFDVQLNDADLTYEELLELVNDINKGDMEVDYKVILEFIKVMLKKWGDELNNRDEDIKMTVKGKIEAGTYTQTRTYLKPLIRMLRKQRLTDDIRDSLLKMVRCALQRDYIICNEAYMEMAIGNAPWPIGVTNAGIHARPARENIFSKHVAHVLNDETQRKYIQGLKRLLTKAQQYYPTDPSRSIDYTKKEDD